MERESTPGRHWYLCTMRISIGLALSACLLPFLGHGAVDASVETRQYFIPGSGPRIELNLAFLGESLTLRQLANGGYQANVELTALIEREGNIVKFAKSNIFGPERMDSVSLDLLHQEYFDLDPGRYDMVMEIRDLCSSDTTFTTTRWPLTVREVPSGLFFSDILFAETLQPSADPENSKYGYRTVPLVSSYYPATLTDLKFYVELYRTDDVFGQDSLYLLTYEIEQFEKKTVHGAFKKVQRSKARPVEAVIAQFDIRDLPSGNYLLALEVRDRQGALRGRQEQFFQRNNPISYDLKDFTAVSVENTFAVGINDRDTLTEFVNCLRPIADDLERKIIDDRLKDKDVELMQRFFYSFWYNRNGLDPQGAWESYEKEVIKVNHLYGTRIKKGYETDRGYVHLKFGPPNSIMDRANEMDAYPYQIWHYYRAGNYSNRRFVFYLPDLVSNDYELLHSDVRSEVQNPRWNQIIHSRNTPMNNVNVEPVKSASGERADEFYEMPR